MRRLVISTAKVMFASYYCYEGTVSTDLYACLINAVYTSFEIVYVYAIRVEY